MNYHVSIASVPKTREVIVTWNGLPAQKHSVASAAVALGWNVDGVIDAINKKAVRVTYFPPPQDIDTQHFNHGGEPSLVCGPRHHWLRLISSRLATHRTECFVPPKGIRQWQR